MIFGSNLSQEKIILIQCERPLFSYENTKSNQTPHVQPVRRATYLR